MDAEGSGFGSARLVHRVWLLQAARALHYVDSSCNNLAKSSWNADHELTTFPPTAHKVIQMDVS